jgi:hypothetical protein
MEKFWEFISCDKNLVILAVFVIGMGSMWVFSEPEAIVQNIITGLFGIAVGNSSNGSA